MGAAARLRTDAQIKQDVLNALKWSSEVKEEHVGVTVHSGAVTLSGHVPTYCAAEEAAKGIAAVKAVVDNVEVRLVSECARPTKAWPNGLPTS